MIKKLLYIMTILTAGVVGLTSCSEDYAQPPVTLPEGGIGTGAWDNPMTAYQALIGTVNPDREEVWVTGYIVGAINRTYASSIHEKSAQFEAPFATNNNILLASTPDERNWKNCVTVQILSSTDARTDLNLVSHPENVGKLVTIKGTTGDKYLGAYSVKNVSIYKWGDQGIYEPEPVPYDGPFYEDFDNSSSFSYYKQLGWKNTIVMGGLSGWYITSFQGNSYIAVSSYLGEETGGPYENWLVSPGIELEKLDQKTIEFVTQAAYQAENSTLEVYVMTGENPKYSTNTKVEANIATPPSSGYSSWVNSGVIDLSEYTGTIYIGWRYYSEHGGSGGSTTYCIDNVSVGGATPSADDNE